MGTVGHRLILPLLALLLVSYAFSVTAPNPVQAGETPTVLPATVTPTERLVPPVTWLDTLQFRRTTYFTKKYPAYDFSPYARELDRVRGALSLGDQWGAKREMGLFLSIGASRAYGLGGDAAKELADFLLHFLLQMMPDEEFGIVYPGSDR